jgi:hypothetical protein
MDLIQNYRFRTAPRVWLRSLGIDSVIFGALVAGLFYGIPYVETFAVFVLWWIFGLGILTMIGVLSVKMLADAAADSEDDERSARFAQRSAEIWTVKLINRMSVSRLFLVYHWLSELGIVGLLLIGEHYVLATVSVFSFLLSCLLIGVARKLRVEMVTLERAKAAQAALDEAWKAPLAQGLDNLEGSTLD